MPRASGFYGEELRPAPSPGQCPGEMHMAPPMLPPEILRNWLLNFKSPGQFRRNGTLIFCRCAKVNLVSDMANPEMKCD